MKKTESGGRNPQETIDEISRLATERRFNPSSFALELGYKRQWGYAFMKNEIIITLPLLMKIAKLLGVSAASLVPGEGTKDQRQSFEGYVRKIVDDEIEKKKLLK